MDGSFTDYSNNLILNSFYGGSVFNPPQTLYFGLSTVLLQKNSNGLTPKEPDDKYYTRIAIANNVTNFPPALAGQKTCNATLIWPEPKKEWGTIKSVFIADASGIRGGNLIDFYNLPTPITVNSGDPSVYVPGGAFQKIFT